MTTPKDMELNEWGHPCGPVTRPRALVSGGAAPLTSHVDQRVDNSVNRSLPWVALACGFGFLGFGAAIAVALMSRGQIEAEGRAVKAEVRAEFSDRFAKLEAEMEVAKYEASIAKNTAQKLEARNERR